MWRTSSTNSKAPSIPLGDYIYNETRYTSLRQSHSEQAERLLREAKQDVLDRWKVYENWVNAPINGDKSKLAAKPTAEEIAGVVKA